MGRSRKPSKAPDHPFVLFDVLYEDGSRTSNRRVPSSVLGGLDGDEPARQVIEEQDQVIAERSGRQGLGIKSLSRSGKPARERSHEQSTSKR